MSQSGRERALRALEQSWRERRVEYQEQFVEESKREYHITAAQKGGLATAFKVCADELSAALDTPQEPTPGPVCFQCAKPATLHFCSDEHARRGNSSPFASRKMETPYPMPCGLCDGQIDSEDDREWHGLGNCVPLCDRCMGSGIEPPAAAPRPALSPDAPKAASIPLNGSTLIAVEYGYRACERGWNLERTLEDFKHGAAAPREGA